MFSLNEVTLLGRLGGDATVRTAGNGSKFATISVATEEAFKDQNGQWSYKTTWHNLCLWGPEGIFPKLIKGQTVMVRGSISYREVDGRNQMDIRVRQIMVQNSNSSSQGGYQQGGRRQAQATNTYGNRQNGGYQQYQKQPQQQAQQQQEFPPEEEDFV